MSIDHDPLLNRRSFLKMTGVLGSGLVLNPISGRRLSESLPALHTSEASFSPQPDWEQDFQRMPDGKPDSRYWSVDTGNVIPSYNQQAETLTNRPENVRIENGLLIIEARKEHLNGRDYTSAHINTQGKFSFQYGKLEVDLRAPKGIGTWPAAWLLPNAAKATWPLDGEIDFFEGIGSLPNEVYPAVHTAESEASKVNSMLHIDVPSESTQFNTYGVELTPGKIVFTCNGKKYRTVKETSKDHRAWPFDQPYYLILNLAMGGSWGGQDRQKYPPDGIQGDGPWEMAVQAIRYYAVSS